MTDINFMVSEMFDIDHELICDPSRIGRGAQFYEDDAFDLKPALTDEASAWFSVNVDGAFNGAGSRDRGEVTVCFERPEDAALFKLRWL